MTDENPRPPADSPAHTDCTNQWPFELSEYLKFDDERWPDDNQANEVGDFGGINNHPDPGGSSSSTSRDLGGVDNNEVRKRVAFKTKSELEILNDGYRWRKYGKKTVKNSPYLRNYYRCSVNGCLVKKRVERDRDDPSYVITTYEGIHTHPTSQ